MARKKKEHETFDRMADKKERVNKNRFNHNKHISRQSLLRVLNKKKVNK